MYGYRGKEYELKKITLGVKAIASDLLIKREELLYNATKDIDLTALDKYRTDKQRLDAELSALEKESQNTDDVKSRLENLEKKFSEDFKLQNTIQHYNSKSQLVLVKLFSDVELLKKIIPQLLTEKVDIDFDDEETEKFVTDILRDFFLKMRMS